MSRKILGAVAIVAMLALAAWLGFSDGLEHRPESPVKGVSESAR